MLSSLFGDGGVPPPAPPGASLVSINASDAPVATQIAPSAACAAYRLEVAVDYVGGDIATEPVQAVDQEACCAACEAARRCNAFTYIAASHDCWLKMHRRHARTSRSADPIVSGHRFQLKAFKSFVVSSNPSEDGLGGGVRAGGLAVPRVIGNTVYRTGGATGASIWDRIRARRGNGGAGSVVAGGGSVGSSYASVSASSSSLFSRRYNGGTASSDELIRRQQERQTDFLLAKAVEHWRGVPRGGVDCTPPLRLSLAPIAIADDDAARSPSPSLWLGWAHESSRALFSAVVELGDAHTTAAISPPSANQTGAAAALPPLEGWQAVRAASASAARALWTAGGAGGADTGGAGGFAVSQRPMRAASLVQADGGGDGGREEEEAAVPLPSSPPLLASPSPPPPPSPSPASPPPSLPPPTSPWQHWRAPLAPNVTAAAGEGRRRRRRRPAGAPCTRLRDAG